MFTTEREEFHSLLKELLGSDQVFFQPPTNTQMAYPAIVYNRAKTDKRYAGNRPFRINERFTVTLICRAPNKELFNKLIQLPMCSHSTSFAANNLNHDVFDIFI